MRTIAELPHPDFKITIFAMNQKFIIKFEQANLEQVYKIAEVDMSHGVDSVFQMLDETLFETVKEQFSSMRSAFNEAYNRYEL